MRNIDLHWMDNREWWEIDDELHPIVRKDAPPEAQESYKHYLEQTKDDDL